MMLIHSKLDMAEFLFIGKQDPCVMERPSRSSEVDRPIVLSTPTPRIENTDTHEERKETAAENEYQEPDEAPIAAATHVAQFRHDGQRQARDDVWCSRLIQQ